jgi:glycosyltransferase involved in cell wall biosynthesis
VNTLTFAIPYYSRPDYLRAAIESALGQSHEDWQLLVIDDSGRGSEAEQVVRSFEDRRMRYLRNPENLGMIPTWNRCLDEASTDLVNLLHADDELLPGYATLMLELASQHPRAAAFFCQAEIMDAQGNPGFSFADYFKRFLIPGRDHSLDNPDQIVLVGGEALRAVMRGDFIMAPTLCYRKSSLESQRFSGEWKQVQDLMFITNLLLADQTLIGSRESAYRYRRHAGSATTLQSESRLRFDEEFRAFDEIAARAEQKGWSQAARVAQQKRIVKLHLLYRAMGEVVRLRLGRATRTLRYLISKS